MFRSKGKDNDEVAYSVSQFGNIRVQKVETPDGSSNEKLKDRRVNPIEEVNS